MLFDFMNFGTLHMPNLQSKSFHRSRNQAKCLNVMRMQITRQNLSRDFLSANTQLLCDVRLNSRRRIGEGTDCTANLTSFNIASRVFKSTDVSLQFRIPRGNNQPKSSWFSVHAMRPPHHHGILMGLRQLR